MDLEFNKNEDEYKRLIKDLKKRAKIVELGGGQKRIDKEHTKGKLTARERIQYLIDQDKPCIEIGLFVGDGMYEEYGGCPSGGVVVVMAYVNQRKCIVVANDATVKAGAWFPITGKKNLRAQEMAMENRLPIIYLVDSAGIFLPMQNEIFADKDHFGRIFRNNAQMSAMGIPQISAIMGSCVAGGAYLPIMSDEALIVNKTGTIFLAGSYLVKSAIGEDVDNETLGGATTHTEISGVVDYKCEDDKECLDTIKDLVTRIAKPQLKGLPKTTPLPAKKALTDVYGVLPTEAIKPYEMKELLKCIVDDSKLTEYKKDFGKSIVCAYANIEGWSVGIVANQRTIVKSGKGEMRMGGVIYSDSADKAARFIMNCNQKGIPLVFFHDVTGFMIGSRSEHGGIIKDGAKMVSAMANSVVPKFTVVVGNSYGAGNYAMCGKAYDPRLMIAWPSAKIGVMSGSSAAKTLVQIKISQMEKAGKVLSEEEKNKLKEEIVSKYNEELSPYYAASRLWVDMIIDPAETRQVLAEGIDAANHQYENKDYKLGVIQT